MITSGEIKAGGGDRDDQMTAIRQILADVNEGATAEPGAEVEERPTPAVPQAPMRKRDDDLASGDTPMCRAGGAIEVKGVIAGAPVPSSCDVAKLRRSHDRRVKKLLRSRARRKHGGAFLTGFTLVSMVAATMVGLYVFHPQIIAASPEMAPAMNEYVVTVDRYRVEVNERTAEWRSWLAERFGERAGNEG